MSFFNIIFAVLGIAMLAAGIDMFRHFRNVRRKKNMQNSIARSLRYAVDRMEPFPEMPEGEMSIEA